MTQAINAHFERIEDRAAALLLTEQDVVSMVDPPMAYVTYWRAKTGLTVSTSAKVKVARRMIETLDRLEKERANA